MACFFLLLQHRPASQSFYTGFFFGAGFFTLGISWVFISIYLYGHLNFFVSGLITLFFIIYLSVYPALMALLYKRLALNLSLLWSCLLFSALWCLSEYVRANLMGGFPWLLLGFSQVDSPIQSLLPIFGLYGGSFFACLAATLLAGFILMPDQKRYLWIIAFVGVLLAPDLLKHQEWATLDSPPLSVRVIQANFSMKDKWDDSVFFQLLSHYQTQLNTLLNEKNQLIVLPESAIPLPSSYISDFIDPIHLLAQTQNTAILLGTLEPNNLSEANYRNTMISLGHASGQYAKQQLVPFGEFIPSQFKRITNWLGLPTADLISGKTNQNLIEVFNHPIATLICYELAYPKLLREQLPRAQWIVSISDDGWFGHSLAIFQHLQMARAASLLAARDQIVANNDGLSSLIDTKGHIKASLPAFHEGILKAELSPASGTTPWIDFGDTPILGFCLSIFLVALWRSILHQFKVFSTKRLC